MTDTGADTSFGKLRAAALERDRRRNTERGHTLLNYVLATSPEDPAAALQAALIGSPNTPALTGKEEPAPFWSVKARQLDLLSFLLGRLIAELEKENLYPLWTTGGTGFDRDVTRALWQLGGGSAAPVFS